MFGNTIIIYDYRRERITWVNIEQQDAERLTSAQLIYEKIETLLSQLWIRRAEVEEVGTVGKDHVRQYLILLTKPFELFDAFRFERL